MSQSWLTPDAEQGGGSATSTGVEHQGDSNWQQESTNPAPASASSSNDSPSSSGNNNKRKCCWWTHLFCGVVLSILFIVAASLEWNDVNLALMWGIFYIVHAILAIVGTIRLVMCKSMLTKPLMFVSGAMLVWSLVLLSLASVDLSKSAKGGSTQGGDSPNQTNREEVGFELGGSILGCVSCIYFLNMCLCLDKAPQKE
jgi:uncharacterized integral membrane protein